MSCRARHRRGSVMRRLDLHPQRALRAICTCAAATLAACSTDGSVPEAPDLRIESLSTRPYLVTGGDVLLSVEFGPSPTASILARGLGLKSELCSKRVPRCASIINIFRAQHGRLRRLCRQRVSGRPTGHRGRAFLKNLNFVYAPRIGEGARMERRKPLSASIRRL